MEHSATRLGAGEDAASRPPHAQDSAIRSFFQGKGVLITGASGFIGKVLVEKLLRSCPEVGPIFLLLRPHRKSGKGAEQRVEQEILGSRCFDRLKAMYPGIRARLRAVQGDISAKGLGISESDLPEIINRVNIVFHCAATVKFNEHLKTAFEINVDGVSNVLQFCRSLKQLDILVHASTAYVSAPEHSSDTELQEGFKRLSFDYSSLRTKIAGMSRDQVAKETESILRSHGGWPNTYTLTKCIGELVLRDERGTLPCVVVRPSIVTCADREPTPGWIDSLVGPAGLVLAVALGVLHVVPGNQKHIVDFIPVDLAVNTILAAAWYSGCKKTGEDSDLMVGVMGARGHGTTEGDPMIVHCASSGANPITWEFMLKAMPPYYDRHPTNKKRGPVFFKWANSPWQYSLLHALWHRFPATWMDLKAGSLRLQL